MLVHEYENKKKMSSANKTCSIAFTLPISCQICLGKVKQPVICPNQHAFCQVCMEFWLSRSPQCPACRIQITKDNPCRPVLGGLNEQHASSGEDFSNRDMRRTRVEVLFKDYENEIERLEQQNELLKEENKMLTERLGKAASITDPSEQYGSVDSGRLKLLMKKLQDAVDVQDKQKRDIKSLREENKLLKEENGKTGIENQKLRMEVVSRSPRRYGRSTVIAMESQLEKFKKECAALNKALEKSDAYVEDLEKELEKYKSRLLSQNTSTRQSMDTGQSRKKASMKGQQQQKDKDQTLKKTFFHSGHVRLESQDEEFDSSDSEVKVKFEKPTDDTFELELPSPMTKGSKAMSKLALETTSEDGLSFLKDEGTSLLDETSETNDTTLELPSPVQNAKKRLKFSENSAEKQIGVSKEVDIRFGNENSGQYKGSSVTRQAGLILSNPVQTGMNTSMSGDMEDCMKLFEEAERKVEKRRGQTAYSERVQGHGVDVQNTRNNIGYERSLSHTGSMGSLSGLIADTTQPGSGSNVVGMRKAGSSHSLASSVDTASTLTLGHFSTENPNPAPSLKPALFSGSLPVNKDSQDGGGIPGIPLASESLRLNMNSTSISGNFLSQSNAVPSISGNFLTQSNPVTSMSGNFLSQSSTAGSMSGKYSASNPFAKSLSQESKRF